MHTRRNIQGTVRSRKHRRAAIAAAVVSLTLTAGLGGEPATASTPPGRTVQDVGPGLARSAVAPHETTAIGTNADGRLEVFAVDTNGGLIHSWQLAAGGWSDWAWMGVFVGTTTGRARPTIARDVDGRLELFAVDPAGGVIHAWQLSPNGTWSAWRWTGAFAREAPSTVTDSEGRINLYAARPDGALIRSTQHSPGGSWGGWYAHPWLTITEAPGIGFDAAGYVNLYAETEDPSRLVVLSPYEPYYQDFTGWWAPLVLIDAPGSTPAVATGSDGRMELFASIDGGLVQAWEMVPKQVHHSTYHHYVSTGIAAAEAPSLGVALDGRLEAFAVQADGMLMHRWQLAPSGPWGDWQWMGVAVRTPPSVARMADGRLTLIAVDRQGQLIQAEQIAPNGTWTGWSARGAVRPTP